MTFLLAQLTDTHVVGPDHDGDLYVDNNARLGLAVERLLAESVPADAVVVTGDLTDFGSPEEMETVKELLAPIDAPVLAVPGNHDRRPTFRDTFDLPWADQNNLSWVVDLGPVALVGLDTLVPNQINDDGTVDHRGLFDQARAEWLDQALAATAPKPTAIAMHHPPFITGIGWMDKSGLTNRQTFADVVSKHDHVNRIFCGHMHRPITTMVGGALTSTGISTIQQVELNLADSAPIQLICDPPGYQLHVFDNGAWISHVRHFDTGHPVIDPDWAADRSDQ